MGEQMALLAEPIRPLPELVYQARLILSDAIEEHQPVAIYIALSGGNDSRVTTHVALPMLANDPRFRGAVLVDTGIALPEAHEAVRGYASEVGVSLTVQRTPESYEAFVLAHGFPGPAQHHRMYQRLKERALRVVKREAKEGHPRAARVMFVSGVRKYESKRRVNLFSPVTRNGAEVWCNPLFWWTTPERNAYQQTHAIPRNPISEIICGSSGDCLCGAMADPHGDEEMRSLEVWFPATARRLRDLEMKARCAGVWCQWGHKPPSAPSITPSHPELFMPMCVGCESRRDAA